MNPIKNLSLAALVAVTAIYSGCGIDNPVEPLGPSLVLEPGVNAVVDSATVAPGEFFLVQINATQGDAALNRIEVREDGSAIDPSRLVFDGDSAQSNPNPVDMSDALNWDIEIQAGGMEATYQYSIIITDENSNTVTESVTITTVNPETPATVRDMVLLLNQDGPVGQGGLDVDSGDQTGTQAADTTADIRDQGIDTDLPVAQNWLQKIASINGTTLKYAAAGTVWEDVETLEDIAVVFESGTDITTESEVVQEGDIFLVETTRSLTYALLVTDINVTESDNNDSYTFEVKGPQ